MDRLQQQLVRYEARLAKWRRISLRNRQALAISTTREAVYTERIRHMKALKRLRGNHLRQWRLNLLEHQARTAVPPPSLPPPPPAILINTECCFDCGVYQGAALNWTRSWRCDTLRCPQYNSASCPCLSDLESPASP